MATAKDHRRHARTHRKLSGGRGCRHSGGVVVPGQGPRSGSSPTFRVGAAVGDFSPPLHGHVPGGDAADCDPTGGFDGKRIFAFEEPYKDQNGNGHYDLGEPYLDCNHNGHWEGDYLGGGNDAPRHYTKVADPVTARALVVSNGSRTVAVEVTDQEGLFNVYQQQIRDRVAADGYHLDGIFISATHDESAPDTLGINGENQGTSSVNDYFNAWLVEKSAKAIEAAYDARRPAHLRYTDALEPSDMRQCWSSYPYVDDQIMPVLQAVGTDGRTIATLASVSQHAETLGFNDDPQENYWISGDWPHWFRSSLEQRYGGVAIEMAGSVGSVESPQVFPFAISRVPQRYQDGQQPANCSTLFDGANNAHAALGYNGETRIFGQQLAAAVGNALDHSATLSRSSDVWGERADACIPLTNQAFAGLATGGDFGNRPGYANNCQTESPVAPNGTTSGNEVKTQVAAFRLGDGEFISLPGEVFPFTYMRGFLGPDDMPHSQYGLPAWPFPHMNAPYRFFDGLAEDMVGYIFPMGNGVGVPGETQSTPQEEATDNDRFGCNHADDPEAASSQAADILAGPLVHLLDKHDSPETVTQGRYVLPDGSLSRDPLGGPAIKCTTDTTYHLNGPATAVELPNGTIVHPASWMALDGRPQSRPDRNTRGYFTSAGRRVWLDVFPALSPP